MLSTLQEETRGLRLYEREGWTRLPQDVWFGGTPAPYRSWGLRLNNA